MHVEHNLSPMQLSPNLTLPQPARRMIMANVLRIKDTQREIFHLEATFVSAVSFLTFHSIKIKKNK